MFKKRYLWWQKIKFWIKLIILSPGIIVHEFAHLIFCLISGVKVYKFVPFRFKEVAGLVVHSNPNNLLSAFLISFGPLFLNTWLTYFFVKKSILVFEEINLDLNLDLFFKFLLFIYLAISIGLSAIPSNMDGKSFGNFLLNKYKNNFLYFPFLVFYIFVWILNFLNFLKKYYFDWFFVIGIILFTLYFNNFI